MGLETPGAEKAHEKHAWTILFALGILNVVLALSIITEAIGVVSQSEETAFGFSWTDLQASNPGAAGFMRFLFRALGYAWLGFGLFTVAVVLKSYRRGERWAWYTCWAVPLVPGLFAATAYGAGVMDLALTYAVFAIVAVVGLLLPYRRFFPRRQAAST